MSLSDIFDKIGSVVEDAAKVVQTGSSIFDQVADKVGLKIETPVNTTVPVKTTDESITTTTSVSGSSAALTTSGGSIKLLLIIGGILLLLSSAKGE